MAIQSSINSLLSQAQSLAAFYSGFKKADQIIGDTTAAKGEAKIQTDIAAGLAPMKDGKVDPEWLQKRREEFAHKAFNSDGSLTEYGNVLFYPNGKLSTVGKAKADVLEEKIKNGGEFKLGDIGFYTNPIVQDYLKSHNDKYVALNSAIEAQLPNSELKNEVAGKVARASVEARTNSINKTKSNFDEHTASLIRYYGKGSGNP